MGEQGNSGYEAFGLNRNPLQCSALPVLINTKVNKCRVFPFFHGKTQRIAELAFWAIGVQKEAGKVKVYNKNSTYKSLFFFYHGNCLLCVWKSLL